MLEFELPSQSLSDAQSGSLSHFGLTDKLLDVIRGYLLRSLPPKQEVIDAASTTYDRYVAPLDIPYVPAILEPRVDAALKGLFLSAVDKMYDAISAQAGIVGGSDAVAS